MRVTGVQVTEIQRVERDGSLPLSFAQQRMWFLDQLKPGSSAYHIPMAVRFTGAINRNVLELCFREIIRRHESLRTNFVEINGEATQVIHAERELPMPLIDMQGLTENEREAQLIRLLQEETDKPFDLSQDMLIRTALVQISAEEHVLVMVMHHIISDAWSIGVFTKELAALYAAYARNCHRHSQN